MEEIMNAIEKRYASFEKRLTNDYKKALIGNDELQQEVELEFVQFAEKFSVKLQALIKKGLDKNSKEKLIADFNNEMDSFETKWDEKLLQG